MAFGLSVSRQRLARRLLHVSPPLSLAALYFIFTVLGALSFKLPGATLVPMTWSEAFFTATSAVTVTGLSVVDPVGAFTMFGEAVLMVLIQLGGLGLMTFAVLVLAALRVPVGLTGQIYLREELNQSSLHRLMRL